MDFNPIDVQENLKGADYPASGEELARTAEGKLRMLDRRSSRQEETNR